MLAPEDAPKRLLGAGFASLPNRLAFGGSAAVVLEPPKGDLESVAVDAGADPNRLLPALDVAVAAAGSAGFEPNRVDDWKDGVGVADFCASVVNMLAP